MVLLRRTEPSVIGIAEAMKDVQHGVATSHIPRVAGRQIYRHHAIRYVTFEVALQRDPVDGDPFKATSPGFRRGYRPDS
jgi:hypothetical protein